MIQTNRSNTIVIQTFRNNNIPTWIQRCLDSVRKWAQLHGYNYSLAGDEFYELCGPEFLARGNKNPRAITNLARLVATRNHLDAGYQRVIWMDADVFVFNPAKLVFDFSADSLSTGYAFGREVSIYRNAAGILQTGAPVSHNAATFFTPGAVDLDILITLIRHIDAKRQIVSNYQIGVNLLRGLQYSLMFPTFSHVGVFFPVLVRALAERDERVLRCYGKVYRYEAYAANLCLSLEDEVTEGVIWKAMDRLEDGMGHTINRHAIESGVHLLPYDNETSAVGQSATLASGRDKFMATVRSYVRPVSSAFNPWH
jgi:hypothetical protein